MTLQISENEKSWPLFKWAGYLISLIMVLSVVDVIREYRSGESIEHLAYELIVCFLAFMLSFFLWSKWKWTNKQLAASLNYNASLNHENIKWKNENLKLLEGLSASIHQQLEAWKLTPAESDVALLLLKGLAFKEIATIRGCSDKTVRQHALMIYQKSALPGRAELSAYFLEDLFAPIQLDR